MTAPTNLTVRSTRLVLAVVLTTLASLAALLVVPPAADARPASPPAIPAGLPQPQLPGGGTITGPTPQQYPPINWAAGQVCSFPIRETFPVNHTVAYTYSNAAGRAVAAYYTGALYSTVTNRLTGAHTTINIGGDGVGLFGADGSFALYGLGPFSADMHPGDHPGPELALLNGFSEVSETAGGTKTIDFSTAPVVNVCNALR